MKIPPHLSTRPLTPADARAVYEVMAQAQLADLGSIDIEEADIVGDWSRPSFDVGASTLGVFDGERLVGYAEHTHADRGDACVHPAYLGQGIGTHLAHWMQDLARSRGASVVGMPVPQGSPGDRLLEALGYHVRWTSWVLKLPAGAEIVRRDLPAGYAVRAADPSEYPAVHEVVEDAFLEWSQRARQPYADFLAELTQRPGHAPWQVRVVTDGSGTIVACAMLVMTETAEGYISRLATRADQRGQGLAQVLMVDSFAVARAHGAQASGLSTDSRTGALGLYEKVGMVVSEVWVNRAIDL